MNRIALLLTCLFLSVDTLAQSPKVIEDDLVKSFKKIDPNSDMANDLFAEKLKNYTAKYPATLSYPFNLLKKERLDLSTSDDGLFRIYSWDTETGGTMHFFESVFQYKSGVAVKSILDKPQSDGDNRPNYVKLYTFKTSANTYYLAVKLTIGSTKDVGQGMQIFAIENGKLNDDIKLIKTPTGLHSQLNIQYDFFSIVDWKVRPEIAFNPTTQTISVPLVNEKDQVTHKVITYKFTGKFFEKVKN